MKVFMKIFLTSVIFVIFILLTKPEVLETKREVNFRAYASGGTTDQTNQTDQDKNDTFLSRIWRFLFIPAPAYHVSEPVAPRYSYYQQSPTFTTPSYGYMPGAAYGAPAQRPRNIWLMDVDGKKLQKLTEKRAFYRYPVFSPDGKTIAYIYNFGLYLINSDGSSYPQLIFDETPVKMIVAWSQENSKELAFITEADTIADWTQPTEKANKQLWSITIGDKKPLAIQKLSQEAFLKTWRDPRISPNGDQVEDYRDDIYLRKNGETSWTNLTGAPGKVETHNIDPSWSPDGNKIIFVSDRIEEIQPVDSSDKQQELSIPDASPEETATINAAWAAVKEYVKSHSELFPETAEFHDATIQTLDDSRCQVSLSVTSAHNRPGVLSATLFTVVVVKHDDEWESESLNMEQQTHFFGIRPEEAVKFNAASAAAKKYAKSRLNFPETAEFHDTGTQLLDDSRYQVSLSVSFEDASGILSTKLVTAVVEKRDDKWELESLNMEQ